MPTIIKAVREDAAEASSRDHTSRAGDGSEWTEVDGSGGRRRFG
jgi:hypothetical protein